ncbi:MAG: dephospho-CoA kinase, partial [Deltaproteobacteria bacterium]
LFEAGAESRVDQVLVVVIDPALQVERLLKRDKINEAEARQRVDAQWPQADKVQKADFVIDNSGSLEQTRHAVTSLYHYLVETVGSETLNKADCLGKHLYAIWILLTG